MGRRIFYLIYKEILAVWQDKKSRMVLIVPPITQLLIFTFAATLDVQNVTIGVLNRDNGSQGFELVQRFEGSPLFKKIVYLTHVEQIQDFIDNARGVMVVHLDEQFSRNMEAGKPGNIQLLLDGRKSNTSQIVAGYANSIIDGFNQDFVKRRGGGEPSTQIVPRNWFNPNLIYYWFNVPNLSGVLTMLIGLIVVALSVARERELGTFDQLLVSPILPFEIMIGKTVPAVIIGMIEGSIIVFVGVFLFGVPFTGSIWNLYLGMFVFVTSIVGIGLSISALSFTQQQAILGTYVFMSPSVLLSGFATPIENMPQWLQYLTYANPLRYYITIAKGVFLKAMPFSVVLHYTWPMALIAVLNLTFATYFFKRKVG